MSNTSATSPSERSGPTPAVAPPVRGLARRFIIVQLLILIVFQKFALKLGTGEIELLLPVAGVSVVLLFTMGKAVVSPARLLCFVLLTLTAVLSAMLTGREFSPGAILLFLIVYIPMLVVVPIRQADYLRILRFLITTMVAVTCLIAVEWAVNLTVGHGSWPDLNRTIPSSFLYSGYNYVQPMSYGSRLIKPNAIVFLEVSYISQFIALALICEAVFFRRIVPILVLTVGLLLTFSGTGILVLVLTAPFLLPKVDGRLLLAGALLCLVLFGVAATTGYLDIMFKRAAEFATPGTSGYARYTASIMLALENLVRPESIITGLGPGSAPFQDVNSLPVTKLVTEYGLLTTIAFLIFFCASMFSRTRSLPIAMGLFWFFNLGGGSLSMPLCVLLCTWLGAALARPPGPVSRWGTSLGQMRLGRPVSIGLPGPGSETGVARHVFTSERPTPAVGGGGRP